MCFIVFSQIIIKKTQNENGHWQMWIAKEIKIQIAQADSLQT